MSLHAVRHIESAFVVTRAFLTPFDIRRWFALALVVFFVSGGLNLPSLQVNLSSPVDPGPISDLPFTFPPDIAFLIALFVGAAIILAVVFTLVGSIMEFVLIESLRTGTVSIRRYWSDRWRQGLRLFGFRIAIAIPALAVFGGWAVLLLMPLITGSEPVVSFGAFLLFAPVVFLVGLVYGVVSGFTTVFVVPLMIQADSGVLAGWRRLWRSITVEWKQYLAYAIIGFILTIVAGFLGMIVVGIVALGVLVPFALLAAGTHATISLASTAGIAVLVALAVIYGVIVLLIWALVQVPIVTYLRYFALLVLGDIDASFDIISEQRTLLED